MHRFFVFGMVVVFTGVLAPRPSTTFADDTPAGEAPLLALSRANRTVASKALPAVVHIVTDSGTLSLGQGSGVIVDAEAGFILTNNHVIDSARTIEVRLHDGRRYPAHTIGVDPPTDLAVIRIVAPDLHALEVGNSDALEVGDLVMTVGNPFGLTGTVSQGIVSAKDRYTSHGILDYEGFIQTDAVINPGNSGGPLVNMRGEIVGINTAIETETGEHAGVGFAVPSSKILRILPVLVRGEKVARGFLGVAIRSVIDFPDRAENLGWDHPYGVMVMSVQPGSPAESADLRRNDIVVNLDGSPMRVSDELRETVAASPPGTAVVLDVWRAGNMVSLRPELGVRPETEEAELQEDGSAVDFDMLGFTGRTLNEALARRWRVPNAPEAGVLITLVETDSPADRAGISEGEVIVAINDMPINDAVRLDRAIGALIGASIQIAGPTNAHLVVRLHGAAGERDVRIPLTP